MVDKFNEETVLRSETMFRYLKESEPELFDDFRAMSKEIKVGDKVTFDTDRIEEFKSDTKSADKVVQDYRKLVLAGADQIGTVKEVGFSIVTVSYLDGWELPVPLKYLLLLPTPE